MRFQSRFRLGLCGLALFTAGVAKADDAAVPAKNGAATALASAPAPARGNAPASAADSTSATARGDASQAASTCSAPASQAVGHHHKGLFGWRHCVECQRAWVKQHDGVDVPPPPSGLPASVANVPGTVVSGPAASNHGHGIGCSACQAATVVGGPATVVESYPPGHAVSGGQVMAGNYPPGYAVSGGNFAPGVASVEPTPVGVSRSSQTRWNSSRVAATGPRVPAGPYDSSVRPSSMIPPQTALDPETTSRPHILSHLFGFDGIARHLRESRDDKAREAHASISYDSTSQPVTALPAAAVYGKDH
ncbi:MAG: hypothetical protein ACLP7Q_23020 [Isosphaeraceae bacterium]